MCGFSNGANSRRQRATLLQIEPLSNKKKNKQRNSSLYRTGTFTKVIQSQLKSCASFLPHQRKDGDADDSPKPDEIEDEDDSVVIPATGDSGGCLELLNTKLQDP